MHLAWRRVAYGGSTENVGEEIRAGDRTRQVDGVATSLHRGLQLGFSARDERQPFDIVFVAHAEGGP